jgi:hypothetical protein
MTFLFFSFFRSGVIPNVHENVTKFKAIHNYSKTASVV